MEEFPTRETMCPPLPASRIERNVRSGAEAAGKLPGKASRDGDFTVSHFSLLFDARRGCVKPRVGSGEKDTVRQIQRKFASLVERVHRHETEFAVLADEDSG